MNRDVKKRATATSRAPQKLKPASKLLEINDPANPPGGIAPRTSGKWQSASRKEAIREESVSDEVAAWERSHGFETTAKPTTRKAMGAKTQPSRHLEQQVRAITRQRANPIVHRAAIEDVADVNAASRGEYEIRRPRAKQPRQCTKSNQLVEPLVLRWSQKRTISPSAFGEG